MKSRPDAGPFVIVSMRTVDHPPVVPGSGVAKCGGCGHDINISPSTVAIMAAEPSKDWQFRCVQCVLPLIAAGDTVMPISPMQAAEILRAYLEATP